MLTLYLSDKPSQLNKDIIAYMDSNLGSIVKMGLYVDFIVAQARNIQTYTQKGIVNFPTLSYQNAKYVGVDNIKEFFNNHYRNFQKKQATRTENDDVNDFWSNTLAKGEEEDNEDEQAEQMKSRAMKAVQERQTKLNARNPNKKKINRSPARPADMPTQTQSYPSNQRKANLEPSTLDVINQMRSSGQEAIDDDLMAKFFENQTETTF